jgi:transposase
MTTTKTTSTSGRHPGGQRSKLTPAYTNKVIEALRAGNYIETACAYAGISTTAYHRWIQEADQGASINDTPLSADDLQKRVEFRDSCARARAEAEVRNVALIQKAATSPKNWAAAGWWLERSKPDRWGRQTKVTQEISGPGGAPIQISDPRELLTRLMAGGVVDPAELPPVEKEASSNES